MKKYYIIFGAIGSAFLFSLAVLILNPRSTTALKTGIFFEPPEPSSFAGDVIVVIGLILLAAVIVAILAYRIYKLCRTLIMKLRKKDDKHAFTLDAGELYTKSQSSENISEWLISTRRGRLDDKPSKLNRKK